jgi:hypothetical protein
MTAACLMRYRFATRGQHKTSRRFAARGMRGSPDPSRRAFGPPQDEGVARRKTQTYGSAILMGPRRAPHGAPIATFVRRRALLSIGLTALNRRVAGQRKAKSSASSWQGLLVVPEGAPAPPECRFCVNQPAGTAPRPASRTPARNALQKDEVSGVYARLEGRG